MRVDRVLAKEVLDKLQPLGVEAALAAIEARGQRRSEKRQQLELALQQARYEAARGQREYDAADPENRLVTGKLERRWNERLAAVQNLAFEIDQLEPGASRPSPRRTESASWPWGRIWPRHGIVPAPRRRRARRSSAR